MFELATLEIVAADGVEIAAKRHPNARFILHGPQPRIEALLATRPLAKAASTIQHTDLVVAFGGMNLKNAWVRPGGVTRHTLAPSLAAASARGLRNGHIRGQFELRCGRLADAAAILVAGAEEVAPIAPRKAFAMLHDGAAAAGRSGDFDRTQEIVRHVLALPPSGDDHGILQPSVSLPSCFSGRFARA